MQTKQISNENPNGKFGTVTIQDLLDKSTFNCKPARLINLLKPEQLHDFSRHSFGCYGFLTSDADFDEYRRLVQSALELRLTSDSFKRLSAKKRTELTRQATALTELIDHGQYMYQLFRQWGEQLPYEWETVVHRWSASSSISFQYNLSFFINGNYEDYDQLLKSAFNLLFASEKFQQLSTDGQAKQRLLAKKLFIMLYEVNLLQCEMILAIEQSYNYFLATA